MDKNAERVLASWKDANIKSVSSRIRPNSQGPTLVCVTRNEAWRLPCFIAHYRKLGVERFVFIDNLSEDTTAEYLSQQPDVDVYLCSDAYNSSAQRGWIHNVMGLYGYSRWYLCLDTDELLVYDGMEEHSLNELTALLTKEGNFRVRGMLLELYGAGGRKEYDQLDFCEQVLAYCRYFDSYGYQSRYSRRVHVEGGVRQRIFHRLGHERDIPELTKYPLFFLTKGDLLSSAHQMLPEWKNYASNCVFGILHYKFSKQDFLKIEEALQRLHHWNGSHEYKMYAQWFKDNAEESFLFEGSKEYRNPKDLVDAGLIEAIDWSGGPHLSTRVSGKSLAHWQDSAKRKQLIGMVRAKVRQGFGSIDYSALTVHP